MITSRNSANYIQVSIRNVGLICISDSYFTYFVNKVCNFYMRIKKTGYVKRIAIIYQSL